MKLKHIQMVLPHKSSNITQVLSIPSCQKKSGNSIEHALNKKIYSQ